MMHAVESMETGPRGPRLGAGRRQTLIAHVPSELAEAVRMSALTESRSISAQVGVLIEEGLKAKARLEAAA